MLANWLYFLALGLVIPVLGRVISTVVNADGSPNHDPDVYFETIRKIRAASDPETLAELQGEAQRHLAENAVHGFLFQLPKLGVYKAGLSGYWASSPVLYAPLKDLRVIPPLTIRRRRLCVGSLAFVTA